MEINYFYFFSFERLFNLIKIFFSFTLSRIIRKPVVWGKPLTLSIEPTNFCNLKCPECPSGTGSLTRPLGLLNLDVFKRLIDEVRGHVFYIQLFFQGEPFINKNLTEMIKYAQKKRIYVSISTNGILINSKNLSKVLNSPPDKLIFSIDGLDEESYQKYRIGGTLEEAMRGLKSVVAGRKTNSLKRPFIEFQFLVMKHNEHQIPDVLELGKKIGVNKTILKTVQVSSTESAEKLLPEEEKYSRYIRNNGKIKIKGKLKNHCFALWRTSVITWDGRIVPCCFDKDANYELGKLNGQSFEKIWRNDNYMLFRKEILINRKAKSMCTNCTEGINMNILDN